MVLIKEELEHMEKRKIKFKISGGSTVFLK